MPIVHRRTFVGKAGKADQIIQHLKDGQKEMKTFGIEPKTRILSDHLSGRTDRIVWEWEISDLTALDAAFGKIMKDPKGQKFMQSWFTKLTDMIHYAEVEHWNIH